MACAELHLALLIIFSYSEIVAPSPPENKGEEEENFSVWKAVCIIYSHKPAHYYTTVMLINKPETNVCSTVYCAGIMTTWIKMLRDPGPWKEQDPFHTNISRLSIPATVVNAQPRISCRSVFKQSEILPVPCQCILSLINFITNNQEIIQTNSSLYSINKGISIIFIDQMPTYLVCWHKNFQLFTT